MAQWVVMWTVFEVCAGEKGHEGGGHRRGVWWCQEAAETQLRKMLDKIL